MNKYFDEYHPNQEIHRDICRCPWCGRAENYLGEIQCGCKPSEEELDEYERNKYMFD